MLDFYVEGTMKRLLCVLLAAAVALLAGCSSGSEDDKFSADDAKTCESIIKQYYENLSSGDTDAMSDIWYDITPSYVDNAVAVALKSDFKSFSVQDVKVSRASETIPVGENDLKGHSYKLVTFAADYTVTCDSGKSAYISSGANRDLICLINLTDTAGGTGWRIRKIANDRVTQAKSSAVQFGKYISSHSIECAYGMCNPSSPYLDAAKKLITSRAGTQIASVDAAIYPHPYRLEYDSSKYDSVAVVMCYDLAIPVPSGSKPIDARHIYDYVYLVKEKTADAAWQIWKIEERSNQQAAETLKSFYGFINSGDAAGAEGLLYTGGFPGSDTGKMDAKKYLQTYMLGRVETISPTAIEVYEGPPGGDFYIDGCDFYHFKISGNVTYKNAPDINNGRDEKDGEFADYIYLIKSPADEQWHIYDISNNP